MEFKLTRNEIRTMVRALAYLHVLTSEHFKMRHDIPNHTEDQDYKDIVALQNKLIQHLENLPY